MGVTQVEAVVTGPTGVQVPVNLLVDSGATYSVLPHDVWDRLELTPKRSISLSLADGTSIERQVSECHFNLPQGDAHSPVILGEPGDAALLGVVTLENLGLVLNPLTRELQPMRMLMT